jgi:hypothetical protein
MIRSALSRRRMEVRSAAIHVLVAVRVLRRQSMRSDEILCVMRAGERSVYSLPLLKSRRVTKCKLSAVLEVKTEILFHWYTVTECSRTVRGAVCFIISSSELGVPR